MTRAVTSLLLGALLCVAAAGAETRVALVIGNDDYETLKDLNNAGRDAAAVAEKLTELGFETTFASNVRENDFYQALDRFATALKRSDIGLFYYAGHGIGTEEGSNFLIPADAQVKRESDLRADAIDAAFVLQLMAEARNPLNIMILDACRDNPLPETTRTLSLGLAKHESVPNGIQGLT